MGSEWSFDFRPDHVWLCEVRPIWYHVWECEVQGVCTPMHVWLRHSACNSQMGCIWVCWMCRHKEHGFYPRVTPILVWVYCDFKKSRCYVSISWIRSDGRESNRVLFLDGRVFLFGRVEVYSVVRRLRVSMVVLPEFLILYKWGGGSMQKSVSRIGPTWCGECVFSWERLWIVVGFEFL